MTISQKTKQSLSLPPGNLGLPLLGETISFFTDPNFNQKRLNKYGKLFKTSLFGRPTVVMVGAEANTFLFKNENKYVVATWPKSTKILLGSTSLAVKTGDFHTSRRKLLYQAFQPRALASYIPTMEHITQEYLNKWEKLNTFTWYPELRNYTFDIASSLLVSTDGGSQTPLGEYFEEWCAGLFTLAIPLPWTKFGKALYCRKKLLQYIEDIVVKRQQAKNPGEDALGLLIQAKDEEGNSLSLEELKDQVLLLLFAGHETLTSAIASFCLLTAQHPEVLQRLREEQQQLSLASPLTLENLKQMTYLEQVLKEVMRIIPPVGGGFREVIESFEFQGYQIPQGWNIQYQIAQTHKDQAVYPDCDRFAPDRFSPDKAEDKQASFAYIPFGGGLRECLGKEFARLEMRIFASMLLKNYQWELLPNQSLELLTIPTPHPRDGLKIKFSPLV
ncbi:(+)-abscisic acid 8'-hydroxylase [Stanieria cyanosphaera PCC 7437]|uniref:(+)-abscisic acid 8'-hydroxylase n=1 Tax=Stanieria cyanosphaera (strain ATCC 29371 / PCC 7437) TaxID=111780 RepID=K9XZ60_STAC7|nr:cytochrome P450 [Stanieria cyanosphaera]AFZ37324.1 (+)-abscisic acid 8'-hydroxylase [Stanieria cyanosphaera PCC 7437]